MADALLELRDVTAGYGPITVLNGVTLTVREKDRFAIIGRNGMGKTTVLRAIFGLTGWVRGRIAFDGADITRMPPHKRAMLGLGYVPQTRDIFPTLTVEENLVSGLKSNPRKKLDQAYALFPRLAERRKNGGMQLSGGEQQMLSVARAILGDPRLLLLDEPLEGLAPLIRKELLKAFTLMSEENGTTIVLVEQQVREALEYAGRVLVMERGLSIYDGQSTHLLADPSSLERLVGVGAH
jgi:branched-chain amino acid transport system ATP-binding protein